MLGRSYGVSGSKLGSLDAKQEPYLCIISPTELVDLLKASLYKHGQLFTPRGDPLLSLLFLGNSQGFGALVARTKIKIYEQNICF